MRGLLLIVLALSAVDGTSGFLLDTIVDFGTGFINTGAKIIEGAAQGAADVFTAGANIVGSVVNTGFQIGGAAVGAFVDPFGWWRPANDDHGHSKGQVIRCPAIADIIFVLDTSSSMSRREYDMETDFAIKLSEHFRIGPNNVRVGALTFSDRVQTGFHLGTHSSNEGVKTALRNTLYLGGGTKTYLALDHIRVNNLFSTIYGARERSSKIVVVLTDGESDNRAATSNAAQALRNSGVNIIAVGVGAGFGTELQHIASDSRHVFSADGFNSLNRIELRVATGICDIPETEGYIPPSGDGSNTCPKGFQRNPKNPSTCIDFNECTSNSPCQQRCVNMPGAFRCTCKAGYVINPSDTTKCKTLIQCTDIVDIIFLVDESGSIGADNFKVQQTFVAKLTHHYVFGPRGANFGGVLFATNVDKLFDLNTYSSRTDVTSALLGANYGEGGTNTHLGLNYIVDNRLFSQGRPNAVKVAIVVTDGESSRPEETKQAANRLKAQGVQVVAVGIGNQVNTDELLAIASSAQDVLVVAEFELLDYIEETITNRICPSTRS